MARNINTGGLTHTETHIAYFTNYIPSITYPLNITSIGPKLLQKVQHKAKEAFLSGMGYNRNMPNAMACGSQKCGGVGLRHLGV